MAIGNRACSEAFLCSATRLNPSFLVHDAAAATLLHAADHMRCRSLIFPKTAIKDCRLFPHVWHVLETFARAGEVVRCCKRAADSHGNFPANPSPSEVWVCTRPQHSLAYTPLRQQSVNQSTSITKSIVTRKSVFHGLRTFPLLLALPRVLYNLPGPSLQGTETRYWDDLHLGLDDGCCTKDQWRNIYRHENLKGCKPLQRRRTSQHEQIQLTHQRKARCSN